MTDRTRATLRLRMPVTVPTEGRRPAAAQAISAPPGRPTSYSPVRPQGSVRLEPSSRAILEELAALGLADAPEA